MINYTEEEEGKERSNFTNKDNDNNNGINEDNSRGNRGWNKRSSIISGIIFILIGCIIIFSNVGWVSHAWRHILISWQMLLIVLGIITLTNNRNKTGGWIMLLIGCFFILPQLPSILPNLTVFSNNFIRNFWPMILIAVGLIIIINRNHSHNGMYMNGGNQRNNMEGDTDGNSNGFMPGTKYSSSSNGYINYKFIFSGTEEIFMEPVFRGGTIKATFGGATIDLRHTSLPEDEPAHLYIDTTFGGVTLIMPTDWNVQIIRNDSLGGFADNRPFDPARRNNPVRLIIESHCTFGGGEIKY